jgi:flagellin
LGASQNRFQSTIRNLSRIVENVSSACSRSRDTDFAKETVELTRAQILQQASTTILRYQTNDHLGFCPCVKANRLSING